MSSADSIGDLRQQFAGRYGRDAEWIVRAPGRVNLIGEHTDYNDGFVLPMAIDRRTVILAARSDSSPHGRITAYSVNLDASGTFDIEDPARTGEWTDYIKGVGVEFRERGLELPAIDLLVHSDVPMGCGLSSSAALQVATAKLLQQLDSSVVQDDDIAALCQAAEHRFAGVPVGIMDQFCVSNARQGHLVFLDCRSLDAQHVAFDSSEVAVLIVDSRVSRELRSGAYAERREQCRQACRALGIESLRDVALAEVESRQADLDDVLFRRARHITSENARTQDAVAAIERGDWQRFGELMYASHESMAKDFEISCAELDALVEIASGIGQSGGVIGARMTGGGFGGCIVVLVERHHAESIAAAMSADYLRKTGLELAAYLSSPAAGASLVDAEQTDVT